MGRQALAVAGAGPELLAGADATLGADGVAPEHGAQREVEPDHRLRPSPDDVAHRRVVAVDHPLVAGGRVLDPLPQQLVRRLRPVRLPVQRIELHGRHAQTGGQRPGERRLAGRAGADHVDAAVRESASLHRPAILWTPTAPLASSERPVHNAPTCRPQSRARFGARPASNPPRRPPTARNAAPRCRRACRRGRAAWIAPSWRSVSATAARVTRPRDAAGRWARRSRPQRTCLPAGAGGCQRDPGRGGERAAGSARGPHAIRLRPTRLRRRCYREAA